ncbi:MAG TPA: hypothetical protein VGZ22_14535 [Isosphaeraceae bacterium]|nr:hypothetical protein [Isosphaeraceae bacterium]
MPATENQSIGASQAFSLRLPGLTGSLSYRVKSGSAQSQTYQITAVEPPAVKAIAAMVEPPAYTKLGAGQVRNIDRIEAWAGSRITLTVTPNKPLRSAALAWRPEDKKSSQTEGANESFQQSPMQPSSDGRQWTAVLATSATGRFGINLEDEHGLASGMEPLHRLSVRVDVPPSVAWTSPDELKESRADDTLIAGVAARDDLAVATAELYYSIERGTSIPDAKESDQVTITLPGLGSRVAQGEVRLTLNPLGLKPGDTVSYRVRVTDSRPEELGGPQSAWTALRRLRIDAKADPLLARRQEVEHKSLRAQLDALKKAAAANRQETEQLRYAADAALRGNGRWNRERDDALTYRETATRDVVDGLQLLARDLEQHPAFRPLARPARQVADVESEAGRSMLEQARRAPDAARRLTDLQQADSRLAAVQQRLDELQRRFEALARLDDDRQRLLVLAERQQQLAAEADALAKNPGDQGPDRARLDHLQAEQEKLRGELEALMKQSPALRGDVLAAQAQESAALAERAHALAEKQHNQARRTANLVRHNAKLKTLADDQRALEEDARRLALEIDPPLGENGRGRVNTDVLDRAVEPIERGEIARARERLEEGENDLRRIARDLDDVPSDPKALARRLARREETLIGQVNEAAQGTDGHMTAKEKAAIVERMKPLLARQQSIARLAAAIAVPEPQGDAARTAAKLAARAVDDLREARAEDFEPHLREARDALNRLADALPDHWRRQEPAREKLGEVRRRSEEISRDLERHLRETGPQPGKPFDVRSSITDLANRVAPLIQGQDEVATMLGAMKVEPSIQLQHDRTIRRARALAEALQAIRDQAALLAGQKTARALTTWHVVGPFPLHDQLPLPASEPADLGAHYKGRSEVDAAWKPATPANSQGMIDLGKIFSRNDNQAAFGYAEPSSPTSGMGQLVIGSDDTLTVWLNGQQVYNFDGGRSFRPDQARVDVPLIEGKNRILIKCGNMGGEWQFAVALAAPTSSKFDPDHVLSRREGIPALQVEARTAIDRLEQLLHGRTPDDELAAELADDQRDLKEKLGRAVKATDRVAEAADQERIATALRGLNLADASLAHDEAVRLAEQAARALADPRRADAIEAVRRATEAVDALAQHLADRLPPRAQVATLARAQRALTEGEATADPNTQARRQRAIANALTRLPIDGKERATELVERAATLANRVAHPNGNNSDNDLPAPTALAESRTKATEALEALAAWEGPEKLPAGGVEKNAPRASSLPPIPDDPELGIKPTQIAAATTLARRERQIRERLQTILGNQIGPQDELRDESTALGRALADLRDRAREISPRSHGPANAAANALGEHAPQVMNEGIQHLAQGRPDAARDAQRRAAGVLEHAAQQTDDLAGALRADRPTEAGVEGTDEGRLSQAHDAQRLASRQLAQARDTVPGDNSTKAAAKSMRAAANGLQAAAQQSSRYGAGKGESTDMADGNGAAKAHGTKPSNQADPHGAPAGTAATDLTQLQDVIRRKTGRAWGELPGHLRTEILQMSQGRYRDDYARLIQLYFREIAAGEPGTP